MLPAKRLFGWIAAASVFAPGLLVPAGAAEGEGDLQCYLEDFNIDEVAAPLGVCPGQLRSDPKANVAVTPTNARGYYELCFKVTYDGDPVEGAKITGTSTSFLNDVESDRDGTTDGNGEKCLRWPANSKRVDWEVTFTVPGSDPPVTVTVKGRNGV